MSATDVDVAESSAELPPEIDLAARRLDLDAARRARAEKRGDPPVVVFLEREWKLPHGLPADVLELAGEVFQGDNPFQAVPAIEALLGGASFAEMKAAAREAGAPLELDDVILLLRFVLEVYEVIAGE